MRVGDVIPSFTGIRSDGEPVTLDQLLQKGPLVIFFYPKAFTAGCTAESCHIRDLSSSISEAGGSVVGISADTVAKQAEFKSKYSFDFPLLSDETHELAKLFGIVRMWPLPAKRTTFVIGQDKVIAAVIASELHMEKHGDEALEVLRKIKATTKKTKRK